MAAEVAKRTPKLRRSVTTLAAGLCLALVATPAFAAELDGDQLTELERLLVRLGFDPGPVDGVADGATASAIEGYQSFAALRVDGVASLALLEELRGVVESLEAPTEDEAPETAETFKIDAPQAEELGAEPPWETAIHLASFKQAAKAHSEWQRLQKLEPALLGGMEGAVRASSLSGADRFFRLYAGPFPNLATAQDFCIVLSLQGLSCTVASGESQSEKAQLIAAAEPAAPQPEAASAALSEEPEEPPEETPEETVEAEETVAFLSPSVVEAPQEAPQEAALNETGETSGESGFADYQTATVAFAAGDCQSALAHYGAAIDKGGLPRNDLATAHNNRGRCLFDQARYDDARADFDQAIGLDPEFAAAYYNRGRVHNAIGDTAAAQNDLWHAYQLGFGRLLQSEEP